MISGVNCQQIIVSWSWLVSLLGAWAMGFYIASPILRGDTVGLQDMDITNHNSMFGVMKDILDGLWDEGLCLLQGTCAFVVDAITRLFTAILDRSIMGVALDRHSKRYKTLRNYPSSSTISVSSFRHCALGGVTKCPCVLVNNIPSSGLVQE